MSATHKRKYLLTLMWFVFIILVIVAHNLVLDRVKDVGAACLGCGFFIVSITCSQGCII